MRYYKRELEDVSRTTRELYEKENSSEGTLLSEIYNAVLEILPAFWNFLKESNIVKDSEVPCLDENFVYEANSQIKNLLDMSEQEARNLFTSLVVKSPFNPDLYLKSLELMGNSNGELDRLANYFGVTGLEKKRQELLDAFLKKSRDKFRISLQVASETRRGFIALSQKYGYSLTRSEGIINSFLETCYQQDSNVIFNGLRSSIRSSEHEAASALETFINWSEVYGQSKDNAKSRFMSMIAWIRDEDIKIIFREIKQDFKGTSREEAQKSQKTLLSRSAIYFSSPEECRYNTAMLLSDMCKSDLQKVFEELRPRILISAQEAKKAREEFANWGILYLQSQEENEKFFREKLASIRDEDIKIIFGEIKQNFKGTSRDEAQKAQENLLSRSAIYFASPEECSNKINAMLSDMCNSDLQKLFEDIHSRILISAQEAKKARDEFANRGTLYLQDHEENEKVFREKLASIRDEDIKIIFGEIKQGFKGTSRDEAQKAQENLLSRSAIYFASPEECRDKINATLSDMCNSDLQKVFENLHPRIRSSAQEAKKARDEFANWGTLYLQDHEENEKFFREKLASVKDEDIRIIFDEIKPNFFTADINDSNKARKDFISRTSIYFTDTSEIEGLLDKFIDDARKRYSRFVFGSIQSKFKVSPESAKQAAQEFANRTKYYYRSQTERAQILRSYLDEIKTSQLKSIFETTIKPLLDKSAFEAPKDSKPAEINKLELLSNWKNSILKEHENFIQRALIFCMTPEACEESLEKLIEKARKMKITGIFDVLKEYFASKDKSTAQKAAEEFTSVCIALGYSPEKSQATFEKFIKAQSESAKNSKSWGKFLGLAAGGLVLAGFAVPAAIAGGIGGLAYLAGHKDKKQADKISANLGTSSSESPEKPESEKIISIEKAAPKSIEAPAVQEEKIALPAKTESPSPKPAKITLNELLAKGFDCLKSAKFDEAGKIFDRVLARNPKSYNANMGKLMASRHVKDINELVRSNSKFPVSLVNEELFKTALENSSQKQREILEKIIKALNRK